MTKTFGSVDLTAVIERSCNAYSGSLVKLPESCDQAEEQFETVLQEVDKRLFHLLDTAKCSLVSNYSDHFYSAGFMDGLRHAAYIMDMAAALKTAPVVTAGAIAAGLQLAETAATEVDEQ